MNVAIVGGGPGGLYTATLLKRMNPEHVVTVYEREPSDVSYGFGVVFSAQTMRKIETYDPTTHAAMKASAARWDEIEVRHFGASMRTSGHAFWAITRSVLLAVLQGLAREAGVDIRFEHTIGHPDELADADLIVAADGSNSVIRQANTERFAPRFVTSASNYIWLAATKSFDSFLFSFKTDEYGEYGSHCYPIEDGLSTFVVDVSDETLARAGFSPPNSLTPGESDLGAVRHLERVFADDLDGAELVVNGSRWQKFRELRNERWSHGNVVLLGDAAHTAHPSVGSGTKMAMEDAIALAESLRSAPSLSEAFAAYEGQRRPAVERIQRAAAAGANWWDWFHVPIQRPSTQFMFHYLTRTPRVTRAEVALRDPHLLRSVEGWWNEENQPTERPERPEGAEPMATPWHRGDLSLPGRLVIGPPPTEMDSDVAHGWLLGSASHGAALVCAEPNLGGAWVRAVHDYTDAKAGLLIDAGLAQFTDTERDRLLRTIEQGAQGGFDCIILDASGVEWTKPEPLAQLVQVIRAARESWPVAGGLWVKVAVELRRETQSREDFDKARELVQAGCDVIAYAAKGGETLVAEERHWRLRQMCDLTRAAVGVPTCLSGEIRDDDEALTSLLSGRAELCWGQPRLDRSSWTGASFL